MSRNQFARQSNGTEFLSVVMLSYSSKLASNNIVVETNIMSYKNGIFSEFFDSFCDFKKTWSIGYHFIVYTCKGRDMQRDITLRIYKRCELVYHLAIF